jgi:PIN domain nuclease of toxin-antitoxin system
MLVAVADTHSVIWYLGKDSRLSQPGKQFFESTAQNGDQIAISSITLIEMVYLIEKNRFSAQFFTLLAQEIISPESMFQESPVTLDIARTLPQIDVNEIPDMPDRIIAATAFHYQIPLISRDRKIRGSNIHTIW